MSAVGIAEAWPPDGRPFTVEDLDRMPDDGRRYELLDGVLLVSPAPTFGHQRVAFVLGMTLEAACPPELIVAAAEVRVQVVDGQDFQPDVVVAPVADVGSGPLVKPPLLVAEISSPSTALKDLNLKRAAYERFGVTSYWVVDPNPKQPSLQVFELTDDCYRLIAHVAGDEVFRASRPFAVDIVPSRLTARLPQS